MEKDFNVASPYVSSTENFGELYSNSVDDFANSGELERLLPNAINLIREASSMGGSLFGQVTSKDLYSTAAKESARLSGNNFMQQGMKPAQNVSSRLVPDRSLTMPQMNNAYTGKTSMEQMPQQNVLFEACSINQPLNASLRERCSTGNYYFLK